MTKVIREMQATRNADELNIDVHADSMMMIITITMMMRMRMRMRIRTRMRTRTSKTRIKQEVRRRLGQAQGAQKEPTLFCSKWAPLQ